MTKTGLRAWASTLGWISGIAGAVAASAYFVNGLTKPSTTVVVELGDPAISLADDRVHDISSVGATATFFFSDMQGADRMFNHLGAVGLCLVVAAVGFALAGQARVAGCRGPLWLVSPSRYAVVLGWAVVAAGVVPQLASQLAASATLSAAGSPAGLSPVGGFDLAWIVAGLGYLATVRTVRLSTQPPAVPHGSPQPRQPTAAPSDNT